MLFLSSLLFLFMPLSWEQIASNNFPEEVEIKGFLVEKEGNWFLSDVPPVPSCCQDKIQPQLIALDTSSPPKNSGDICTYQGRLLGPNLVLKDALQKEEYSTKFLILGAFVVFYLIFRRSTKGKKVSS